MENTKTDLNCDFFTNKILNSTKHFIKNKQKFRYFQLGTSDEIFERHLPFIATYSFNTEETAKDTENNNMCLTDFTKIGFNLRSTYLEDQNKKYDNILTKRFKNFYPILKSSKVPLITQQNQQPNLNTSGYFNTDNSMSLVTLPYIPERLGSPMKVDVDNKSVKRFHNDIFNQKEYEGLTYNEEVIFKLSNKQRISRLIDTKYVEISNKKQIDNDTASYTKTLMKQGRKYFLNFQSIKISFLENRNGGLKSTFDYTLPFELLPLFYRVGIKGFKKILSKLFLYNPKDPKQPFIVKLNELLNFLSRAELAQPNPEAKKPNVKTKQQTIIEGANKKRISKADGQYEEEYLTEIDGTNFTEDEATTQKQTETTNIYRFAWVTPTNAYTVEITMPHIILQESYTKVKIAKYVNYYLLFFLYEREFGSWDFYIMNYLFSFTKCRNIIDKITSKKKINDLVPNSYHQIERVRIDEISTDYKNIEFICTLKEHEDTNYLCRLDALKFNVCLTRVDEEDFINENFRYIINFSFEQMIKIVKCLDTISINKLKYFLLKFAEIKKTSLTYDFTVLNISKDEEIISSVILNIAKFSGIQEEKEEKKKTEQDEKAENQKIQIKCDISEPSLTLTNYVNINDSIEFKAVNILETMKESFISESISLWPDLSVKSNEENLLKKDPVLPPIRINDKKKTTKRSGD